MKCDQTPYTFDVELMDFTNDILLGLLVNPLGVVMGFTGTMIEWFVD